MTFEEKRQILTAMLDASLYSAADRNELYSTIDQILLKFVEKPLDKIDEKQ